MRESLTMKRGLQVLIVLLLILAAGTGFWYIKSQPQNAPSANQTRLTEAPALRVVLAYSFAKANQLPVIVAEKKGFFKKNNLQVEIKQVSKNVASVVASGQADIAIGTPNIFLSAAVEGAGLSWIGSINNDQALAVVSTKNIKNIKTAGVISGPAKAQTIGLLKYLDVNTDKITYQEVAGNPERLLALQQKQVDVIHVPKTDWLIFKRKAALSDEYKILLDSSVDKKVQMPISIIARNDYLKNNKTATESLAKALMEANDWIKNEENKEGFIEILQERYPDSSPEDVTIEAESYISTLAGLEFAPSKEKGQEALNIVAASNPKAKDYNLNNFIDTSITDSLKNSGFLNQFDLN